MATKKRNIVTETDKQTVGNSGATSSHRALMFNLVSSETIRRLAKRKTEGAIKHGLVNWRQGINDAEYVADRFNHLVNHLLNFKDKGNRDDDELGGILWAVDALIEVERLCPEALKNVVGICDVFGEAAKEWTRQEQEKKR